MSTTDDYKWCIGKKCCFCKKVITKKEQAAGEVTKLVGGSCPKRGKPMHEECYDRVIAHLFRG